MTGRVPPGAGMAWCELCLWVDTPHACPAIGMTPEEEDEVLRELSSVTIDRPASNVHPAAPDDGSIAWYSGVVSWRTQGGWIVSVFNDCGEWDYLERVEAPDGRVWLYPCGEAWWSSWHAMTERVSGWTPISPGTRDVQVDRARLAAWPGSDHLSPDPREIA